jgi:hypothetical protein
VLRILFDGHLQNSSLILKSLSQYALNIQRLEFSNASGCLNASLQCIQAERELAESLLDEHKLNQLYVVNEFLGVLQKFSLFWNEVYIRDFIASWNTIQDTQDKLRNVKKFNNSGVPFLKFIEQQITGIEKLYPYKIFASIEAIMSDVKCSICNKSIESPDCPHIGGELYGGKMAYGNVGKIESISAIAIVNHPADKRAVIKLENTDQDFSAIDYLSNLLFVQKITPWQVRGVQETIRKAEFSEFKDLQPEDKCPCESGKTFRDCCFKNGYVKMPHMKILVNNHQVPMFLNT